MGKDYTVEDLMRIYELLYEMNLSGAEDNYLEYYEQYSPANCLTTNMEQAEVIRRLRSLTDELYNDLGNEDELKCWLSACGVPAELQISLLE